MRCLYCGKQLALLRRLTGSGEFCSDAHKQSYHEEYNRLALTRLIAAQSKPDEVRSKHVPSTIQLAMGDRQGPNGGNGSGGRTGGRWHDAKEATASRMIPTPTEVAAPPSAPFITTKLVGAPPSVATLAPNLAPDLAMTGGAALPPQTTWEPKLAPGLGLIEEPPHSPHLPTYPRSLPVGQLASAPSAILESGPDHAGGQLQLPVLPRLTLHAGLSPQGPIVLDPVQFAPRFDAQPERVTEFQPLRFALMLFGAPDLPALEPTTLGLPGAGKPRPIHHRRPALAPEPAEGYEPEPDIRNSIEALRAAASPVGSTRPSIAPELSYSAGQNSAAPPAEPKRQAPAQAKLAGLAAALAQEPKRSAFELDSLPVDAESEFPFEAKPAPRSLAERLAAGGLPVKPRPPAFPTDERPGPQLPTIPADSKRPTTLAIPSILESTLEATPSLPSEREQTLWDRLRRYIKG